MKRYWMSGIGLVAVAVLATVGRYQSADAHCQVPCGIYDDPARINGMLEDQATIEKAMNEINEASGKHDALAQNQLARWVNTKEQHASNIITVVSEYFLTQKLKDVPADDADYDAYLEKLAVHHRVLRAAMKTKQTVDVANAAALKKSIEALGRLYAE